MAKDQVVDVVEEPIEEQTTKVTVVECKEGIVMKAKKHWKILAAAAAGAVVLVGAKLLKSRKDSETDYDSDEFDDGFDDDLDESEPINDPVDE